MNFIEDYYVIPKRETFNLDTNRFEVERSPLVSWLNHVTLNNEQLKKMGVVVEYHKEGKTEELITADIAKHLNQGSAEKKLQEGELVIKKSEWKRLKDIEADNAKMKYELKTQQEKSQVLSERIEELQMGITVTVDEMETENVTENAQEKS